MKTANTIEIKAYSISELARMYGISNKSMHSWLKPHAAALGKRVGRYYTALQVRMIFDKFGPPEISYEITPKRIALSFLFPLLYVLKMYYLSEPEMWQF